MYFQLLHELNTVNENTKESPFGYAFSVKCRALVLSHIDRLTLPEDTLQKGTVRNMCCYATYDVLC